VPALTKFNVSLPSWLAGQNMHLDPDFSHLSYGDHKQRGIQITSKLNRGDLLVFYSGFADTHPNDHLVYAIIGLYVIDRFEHAGDVPPDRYDQNAHTRLKLAPDADDIVVRAQPRVSGRLKRCIPIGSFRTPAGQPDKRPSYRVDLSILEAWGGLSVTDGFLQRSARLPEFLNAERFYEWFQSQKPELVANNGWSITCSDGRRSIDPDGRYPAEGLRAVETNAERVLRLVPGATVTRTRDAIQIGSGGERGITVLVTAEAFELRLPSVEWTKGAYGPAECSSLWRRVKADGLSDEKLATLLKEARQARLDQFKKCKHCGEEFPPERRHSRNVCHGCASQHEGVVY
jgi:hypothetical protein